MYFNFCPVHKEDSTSFTAQESLSPKQSLRSPISAPATRENVSFLCLNIDVLKTTNYNAHIHNTELESRKSFRFTTSKISGLCVLDSTEKRKHVSSLLSEIIWCATNVFTSTKSKSCAIKTCIKCKTFENPRKNRSSERSCRR